MWVAFALQFFFNKKFQHICVSLDLNFNESLTNDIVSFEQLGPVFHGRRLTIITCGQAFSVGSKTFAVVKSFNIAGQEIACQKVVKLFDIELD